MQLNRWQRETFDPHGDNLRRAVEEMKAALLRIGLVLGWFEHLQHGGPLNERRPNKWVRVADVKARYKGKKP